MREVKSLHPPRLFFLLTYINYIILYNINLFQNLYDGHHLSRKSEKVSIFLQAQK